jgi:hypothetical protein
MTELITESDLQSLKENMQVAIEQANRNRAATAFARWAGKLSAQDDPVMLPIVQSMEAWLVKFVDEFFARHPQLDPMKKDQVIADYKRNLMANVQNFVAAQNTLAADESRSTLLENFVDDVSENPALRALQIEAIQKELSLGMNGLPRINMPKAGSPDRAHGNRTSLDNNLGIGVILFESLATGYAMSNGVENYAYREYGTTLSTITSMIPGTALAGATALGFQALIKSIFRNKKPSEGYLRTILSSSKLTVWAVWVAVALGAAWYYDYISSKSAFWIWAATSGEVKNRAWEIWKNVAKMAESSKTDISLSIGGATDTVKTMLENEEKRWGTGLFHAVKTLVFTGWLVWAGDGYTSIDQVKTAMQGKTSDDGKELTKVYVDHLQSLWALTLSNDSVTQDILRDPKISYTAKMTAIQQKSDYLWKAAANSIAELGKTASKEPVLNLTTMIRPSQIWAFANGAEAAEALKVSGSKNLISLWERIGELSLIAIQLTRVYKTTADSIEGIAGDVLWKKKSDWKTNTLPEMKIDIKMPDIAPITNLANSPLGDFRWMTGEESMKKIAEVYGEETRADVESFIIQRTAIVFGILFLFQIAFNAYVMRKRAKTEAELAAMKQDTQNQVSLIVDELYRWTQNSLSKFVSRPDGSEVVSRPYCEHVIWSWMIDQSPAMREFAPPTFLGDKSTDTDGFSRAGKYLMSLVYGDTRSDSDRRTAELYKIFKTRIQSWVLMTSRDIFDLMAKFHIEKNSDLAAGIEKLASDLSASNTEYALRSGEDGEVKKYIKTAEISLSMERDDKVAIIQKDIDISHTLELKWLINSLTDGKLANLNPSKSIDSQVETILNAMDTKYDGQLQSKTSEVDSVYQMSPLPIKNKPKFWQKTWAAIRTFSNRLFIPKTKIKPKTQARTVSTTVTTNTSPVVEVAKPSLFGSAMPIIKTGIEKHSVILNQLSTPQWITTFLNTKLAGQNSLIPMELFAATKDMPKYQSLIEKIDIRTSSIRSIADSMTDVTDITTLRDAARLIAMDMDTRHSLIIAEGDEFQKWMLDISGLIGWLDSLTEHDTNFVPPVMTGVPVSGTLDTTELATMRDRTISTLTQVAEQKLDSESIVSTGIPIDTTGATLAVSVEPTQISPSIYTPEQKEQISIFLSVSDRDLVRTIRSELNKRTNLQFSLPEWQIFSILKISGSNGREKVIIENDPTRPTETMDIAQLRYTIQQTLV